MYTDLIPVGNTSLSFFTQHYSTLNSPTCTLMLLCCTAVLYLTLCYSTLLYSTLLFDHRHSTLMLPHPTQHDIVYSTLLFSILFILYATLYPVLFYFITHQLACSLPVDKTHHLVQNRTTGFRQYTLSGLISVARFYKKVQNKQRKSSFPV